LRFSLAALWHCLSGDFVKKSFLFFFFLAQQWQGLWQRRTDDGCACLLMTGGDTMGSDLMGFMSIMKMNF
jgi:hypothetical protein